MAITAGLVKELRDKTGVGMMDAKKALVESDGDMEAAVDWLRKKGLAKAEKKAGRTAAEGLVAIAVAGGKGVAVEVNSETDFVARNAEFQALVGEIAQIALGYDDIEALKAAPMAGKTVQDAITDKVATIGENMTLRRMAKVEGDLVAMYVHNAVADGMGKIGCLVALRGGAAADGAGVGRQAAMHVAAHDPRPQALDVDDLDPALVEREKNVLTDQARASGKPDNVIEKMITGRLNKFYQEVCLLRQNFVMNPDLTVAKAVAEGAGGAVVAAFARLEVGEGIEKEEEDFAAEVAKTLGG
ncbi:MAG: translation elongation factor Ts [Pseudomonadota bacterium]